MYKQLMFFCVLLLAATPALALQGPNVTLPAYYDGDLYTMLFKEQPPMAEKAILEHNKSFNIVYQSDPGLPGGQPFISVLDAIQADGFNALWREVQIAFNPGFTPHQFFSDNEILAAASGANPEITLTPTKELYVCAVIGPKKNRSSRGAGFAW